MKLMRFLKKDGRNYERNICRIWKSGTEHSHPTKDREVRRVCKSRCMSIDRQLSEDLAAGDRSVKQRLPDCNQVQSFCMTCKTCIHFPYCMERTRWYPCKEYKSRNSPWTGLSGQDGNLITDDGKLLWSQGIVKIAVGVPTREHMVVQQVLWFFKAKNQKQFTSPERRHKKADPSLKKLRARRISRHKLTVISITRLRRKCKRRYGIHR